MSEPTSTVELTLVESGTLCSLLMQSILNAGGTSNQPAWVLDLYTKLAVANDKLRYPEGDNHGT